MGIGYDQKEYRWNQYFYFVNYDIPKQKNSNYNFGIPENFIKIQKL